jgi:hypothetical protein
LIRLTRSRLPAHLPPGFTGKNLSAKLVKLVEARHRHKDQIDWKKIGDWSKAKAALQRDSRNKCAYCESDTAKVAHGDVEHFRPKSKYWWLAFCIDNYVYACQLCNQPYKSDFFPIKGTALKAPKLPGRLPGTPSAMEKLIATVCPDPVAVDEQILLKKWFKENADLPNPYLEDPEPLLAWAVSEVNGEVLLVSPTTSKASRAGRAVQAAIQYLGLNRETLSRSRFLIYQQLRFSLIAWKALPKKDKPHAEKAIRLLCDSGSQYAGMSRYFARADGFKI